MVVSPTRARSRVVLPAPFGPASATRSRRSTLNDTPSNSGSPENSLRRLDAITTATAVRVRLVASVLALDIGTSSVRACRFDETAEERGPLARRDYPGENDPGQVLAHARAAIEESGGADRVDAVGGSCFGHSLLAIDERGRPLTSILSWRDTRSAEAADLLLRRVDNAAVHARTGCQIHTSYWPAKLAWLAQEEPEVFRAAHRFVSFCDYLYAQLLGRDVPAGISIASATGLLDLSTRTWDEELLDTLGVDDERLPVISDAAVDGWYPALLDGACSNFGA